ncbi:LysM peptidoglycan-binding domain-containing protein [Verrucomicrobia bacterium S94]|nr:LysM peptidoglycan-binding domain-containing protein [Verrucomicrobia bacterium S94]
MAKPIYAGTYNNRGGGRWKTVFVVIILIQVALVAAYMIWQKDKKTDDPETAGTPEPAVPAMMSTPEPLVPGIPEPIHSVEASPAILSAISDAEAALEAGQLLEAKSQLDDIVARSPNDKAIELLGDVNIRLLKSSIPMPGKERYSIQPGDYLQKIAKKYNITVALIKDMNGMKTDTIRAGAALVVYNGNFSIRVSKSRNTLDLMAGDKLFKRYPVGTGKFGKTPAIEFKIVDKITEPPWTRFTDGKQIEYGDPENVLGTRWMKIVSDEHPEITGFGIHGTWERDSIGKQSSAGCVRMLNEDVEELFDIVPRKTTVIISD